MASLFILHLLGTYTCLLSGILLYSLLAGRIAPPQLFQKPIPYLFFTGLIGVTIVGQLLALLVAVNYFITLLLLLVYHVFILLKWPACKPLLAHVIAKFKGLHAVTIAGFVCSWALLLVLNAGPTLMDDTESYHIQMVKWIQGYGTVPGIANLHERYGFNSSWFSSVALFSLPTQYNYYTVLNGMISVWLSLFFWMQADTIFKATPTADSVRIAFISLALLCTLFFLWPLVRGNVSTVNYDFITSAMVVVLFFETFSKPHATAFDRLYLEYFLWPIYFFTVRIINFPLLLLSLFVVLTFAVKRNINSLTYYVGLAALLVVPFLVRNVLLSGYAFYPSPYFDLFDVDWKVDPKVLDDLLYYIKYFNRVNNMYQSLQETAALQFPVWIGSWYNHLFSYDKPLLLAGVTGFAALFLRPKFWNHESKAVRIMLAALLCQLVLWFIVAPDPRFVYGPLLCGAALLLFATTKLKLSSNIFKILSFSVMGILILFTAVLSFSKFTRDERYRNPLVSQQLPQPPLQSIQMDAARLHIPHPILNNWNPRCYAAPLPCLYKVDERLHLRGRTIKQGFSIQ